MLAQACFAQIIPTKIEVSAEQVNVNGVLFYLHKVEEKQTLYSISKAYETDVKTIINDNPDLSSGLKKGTLIYIRVANQPNKEQASKEESIKDHKTEDKQIGNKQTAIITNTQIQAQHIVKWYESLSSIAKKYGVTEIEIAHVNSLINNKIETRQLLNIPLPGVFDPSQLSQKADSLANQVDYEGNLRETETHQKPELFKRGKFDNLTVSLLLPLGGSSDSIKNKEIRSTNNFIEFYQGFLLAIEDIKKANPGIKLKVKIIDTDEYRSSNHIVESGALNMSNIIIGPIFTENIEPILKYAQKEGIYVVSPMDPESDHLANEYSNFYQVSTPISYQQRGILSAIDIFSNVTLIFEDTGADPGEFVNITREILEGARIRYNAISYTILKGRSILPSIEDKLKQGSVNHVIVASNSEAFVSDVLRNLNLLKSRRNYEIVIYGTPRWRSFETIEIDYYHGMNLNISMQYYVDYNRESIKDFLSKFRALYNSEPSPYAFQAYDIANYFIGGMWRNGNDFINNTQDYKREMLHSDYNFIRKEDNGGYINTAIRRVIYKPDYSTSDIRGFFR